MNFSYKISTSLEAKFVCVNILGILNCFRNNISLSAKVFQAIQWENNSVISSKWTGARDILNYGVITSLFLIVRWNNEVVQDFASPIYCVLDNKYTCCREKLWAEPAIVVETPEITLCVCSHQSYSRKNLGSFFPQIALAAHAYVRR
jgi:hypothetical protein